jgi:hypothetical protein
MPSFAWTIRCLTLPTFNVSLAFQVSLRRGCLWTRPHPSPKTGELHRTRISLPELFTTGYAYTIRATSLSSLRPRTRSTVSPVRNPELGRFRSTKKWVISPEPLFSISALSLNEFPRRSGNAERGIRVWQTNGLQLRPRYVPGYGSQQYSRQFSFSLLLRERVQQTRMIRNNRRRPEWAS